MDEEIRHRVLREMTYGLWVLSTASGEDLEASTVTWLSQASFKPPLVMVAVKEDTHLRKVVERSGAFALHLLAESQQELAGSFTRPTAVEPGKVGGVAWRPGPATGSPVLEGFSTWLEARVTDVVKRGDHSVFIAEVVNVEQTDPAIKPLRLASTPWYYGG